jgi:hypothetical protein
MIPYINIIFIGFIIWLVFFVYMNLKTNVESFSCHIEGPAPAPTSYQFRSPKSNIMNFNETTTLHQDLNVAQPSNSETIGPFQPIPEWVYPFTYVNRRFDQILLTLAHKMEKDFNLNMRLHNRNNQEWQHSYPYTIRDWVQMDPQVKTIITDVIDEINRRFNLEVPIVGFRKEKIKYYWRDPTDVFIIIKVYKRYTFDDIKYPVEIDPNINQHLKSNFEREMLINVNISQNRYHLKYLRFPALDYSQDVWDDFTYVKELDNLFYLAKSREPLYRMVSNTEARDEYIKHIQKKHEQEKYKCFSLQLELKNDSKISQIKDQTICEQANALWGKQCEKDTDCPYYKGNKNYPNDFGGCDTKTGYCQMPYNVKPLTYRKPGNPDQAFCYNCPQGYLGKDSVGPCCQEQDHPDYMFLNDVKQRQENSEILRQKGLNWSKYPGGT